MPRQTANGEAKNAPFVLHPRLRQPIGDRFFTCSHYIFERLISAPAGEPLHPKAGQWDAGRGSPDADRCTPPLRRKETAAVGERQQVAYPRLGPTAIGDTLGQHAIEQAAAPRRKQTRTQVTLNRQLVPGGEITGTEEVATFIAETLQAEVVRHALRPDPLQPRIELRVIGVQIGQAQAKAIGRMCAALQLALMANALEQPQAVIFGGRQIGVGLARQMQAEPLPGQRLTILQARIADQLQWHAGSTGDALGGLLGVEVALFHPEPEVLTLPDSGMSSTSSTWKSSATALSTALPQGPPWARGPSS